MSVVYLLRHGQAGTRDDYDRLSPTGEAQARRLGLHFALEGIRPDCLLSGELRRQQETARCVGEAFPGLSITTSGAWNEFDLDAVYRGIAPQLAQDDPEFRLHWQELEATLATGDHGIHRRWTRADTGVVRAWVQNRYTYPGESWPEFCARVEGGFRALATGESDVVLISTSATPAAICIGLALDLAPRQVMRLAGATYNASFSILRRRGDDLHLATFNAIPHLTDPALRTYR